MNERTGGEVLKLRSRIFRERSNCALGALDGAILVDEMVLMVRRKKLLHKLNSWPVMIDTPNAET